MSKLVTGDSVLSINHVFRERFTAAMSNSDMGMNNLAYLTGYSESYLRRLKNGHMNNPTISVVWAIAEPLGVKPTWLLGED